MGMLRRTMPVDMTRNNIHGNRRAEAGCRRGRMPSSHIYRRHVACFREMNARGIRSHFEQSKVHGMRRSMPGSDEPLGTAEI
ncbi:hypothetical protein CLG96_03200 [Sphingomonas oleivorans]|uniref:Uncharacterized protein n=1 Tax=Sphingomonas oleivorans TaxID=1735121 RepID=A0A2T5G1Y7_9SPHN|nr:hypothetical protein CLG96_03200 [Sphingomonas oleivorans]